MGQARQEERALAVKTDIDTLTGQGFVAELSPRSAGVPDSMEVDDRISSSRPGGTGRPSQFDAAVESSFASTSTGSSRRELTPPLRPKGVNGELVVSRRSRRSR